MTQRQEELNVIGLVWPIIQRECNLQLGFFTVGRQVPSVTRPGTTEHKQKVSYNIRAPDFLVASLLQSIFPCEKASSKSLFWLLGNARRSERCVGQDWLNAKRTGFVRLCFGTLEWLCVYAADSEVVACRCVCGEGIRRDYSRCSRQMEWGMGCACCWGKNIWFMAWWSIKWQDGNKGVGSYHKLIFDGAWL